MIKNTKNPATTEAKLTSCPVRLSQEQMSRALLLWGRRSSLSIWGGMSRWSWGWWSRHWLPRPSGSWHWLSLFFFFRSTRFVPDHLDDDIDECFLPGVRDMWWMCFFSRSARYVLQRVEAVIAVVEHFQTTLDSPGKHISYHLVNNKWTNEHNVDPLTWQLP